MIVCDNCRLPYSEHAMPCQNVNAVVGLTIQLGETSFLGDGDGSEEVKFYSIKCAAEFFQKKMKAK